MKQIIIDMLVKTTTGIIHTTNRDNMVHIGNGASCNLIMQGEALSRYSSNVEASEGDTVNVLDHYGSKLSSGTVVGKTVREWDMSLPLGKRCTSLVASDSFKKNWEMYLKQVKK